jgi:hypothetical protein
MRTVHRQRRTALYAALLSAALIAAGSLPGVVSVATADSDPGRVVDVTQPPFNATGNGTTNDRAAIQEAIDSLSRSGGGIVQLPAGRTFLSGNLALANDVTLEVDGTLLQSQNPSDYSYQPILGHTGNPWFKNYPFIYAGGKHNVGVVGTGTLQMTQAPGGESATIHVVVIGFARGVDNFTIAGLKILNGHGFNVQARETTHGVIRDLHIDTRPDNDKNGDGINVNSSQYIRITGNDIYNTDDAIVIGSSYGDPRDGTWWLSNSTSGGSQHIEVDHNVFENKPIAFYPLANSASDERWTEVKDIDIHDNYLPAGVHAYCTYGPSGNHQTAVDQVRIVNNDYTDGSYTFTGALTDINRFSNFNNPDNASQIECTRMTDLVDDFGKLSSPAFLNPGFEETGTAYWSSGGDAGAATTADPSVGPHNVDARRAAASFTDGGWYGYVEGPSQKSTLYQGLGLSDAVRYQYHATLLTSGDPARMYVQNTCTGETVAQQTTSNESAQVVTLDFTAVGTCGDYRMGVDRVGAPDQMAQGWVLIDDAGLTMRDTVIDDAGSAFSYSGPWKAAGMSNPIDNTYHQGLAQGATASVSFTGSRAFLFGLLRSDEGQADVYLDGAYRGRVDFYNPAWVDHRVVFDSGPIADGPHTLEIVATGTHNPDSHSPRNAAGVIQLDALVAQP